MSKKNGAGKQQSVLFSQAEIGKLLETVPSNLRGYIDSLQNQISNMSAIGLALSKSWVLNYKGQLFYEEDFYDYFPKEVPAMPSFKLHKYVSELLVERDIEYRTGVIYSTNRRVWEHDEKFKITMKLSEKITIFIGVTLFAIFIIGLAWSISTGLAGFWRGLPFWVIIIFTLFLLVFDSYKSINKN